MQDNKNRLVFALAALALAAASVGHGKIVFQEDFSGATASSALVRVEPPPAGEPVEAGPPHGQAWQMTLHAPSQQQGLLGHRLTLAPSWSSTGRLHWAAYVKFGDQAEPYYWQGMERTPFELRLPMLFSHDGQLLLMGRFRAADKRGRFGIFELVTADGTVHRPRGAKLLAANRWYAIEFGIDPSHQTDRIRIWIDSNDPAKPDYLADGDGLSNATGWQGGLQIEHGYLLNELAAPRTAYYDTLTIAGDFIGLQPQQRAKPPAAPASLQAD